MTTKPGVPMMDRPQRYLTREEWQANVHDHKPRPFPKIERGINPNNAKEGFWQTVDGRYWVINDQLGYVEVREESSRALRAALTDFRGAA